MRWLRGQQNERRGVVEFDTVGSAQSVLGLTGWISCMIVAFELNWMELVWIEDFTDDHVKHQLIESKLHQVLMYWWIQKAQFIKKPYSHGSDPTPEILNARDFLSPHSLIASLLRQAQPGTVTIIDNDPINLFQFTVSSPLFHRLVLSTQTGQANHVKNNDSLPQIRVLRVTWYMPSITNDSDIEIIISIWKLPPWTL